MQIENNGAEKFRQMAAELRAKPPADRDEVLCFVAKRPSSTEKQRLLSAIQLEELGFEVGEYERHKNEDDGVWIAPVKWAS